jgi:hypothetical protein
VLGLPPIKTPRAPKTARLLKRLEQIDELVHADQRTVLNLVGALIEARRRTTAAERARKGSRAFPDKPNHAAAGPRE